MRGWSTVTVSRTFAHQKRTLLWSYTSGSSLRKAELISTSQTSGAEEINEICGRPRQVNDAWTAAYCLVRKLPLAIFNAKDFLNFAEYNGLVLMS